MPFYFTTEQEGIKTTLLITDWPSIMANHGPTIMTNQNKTLTPKRNQEFSIFNQEFSIFNQEFSKRNQNFQSHAIREYCCEQNYGRF